MALSVSGLIVAATIAAAFWQAKQAPDQTIAEFQMAAQTSIAVKENMVKQYLLACKNQPCIWQAAQTITSKYGPQVALDSLDYYKQSYPAKATGDSHEWAHVVGRQTAATYGTNGPAFLKCPTSFNYGCQHGFFEKALGQANSPREAIAQICGQLETDPKYSPKFKFYCYHGVGHGVMQSLEYDLKGALAICDSLDGGMAQDGCWQGVFTENINGEMKGEAQAGVFLADDPLAPCDKVSEKYQHECYINHSAHLMKVFQNNVKGAARACLMAGASQTSTCLEAIGLMVTNDTWAPNLKPAGGGSIEARGWQLCKEFPEGHIVSCVMGGVDHILQMDALNISRAGRFCELTDAAYQSDCFRRLGAAVRAQTVDSNGAVKVCSSLHGSSKAACQQGAAS